MEEKIKDILQSIYTDGEIAAEDYVSIGSRDRATVIDEGYESIMKLIEK